MNSKSETGHARNVANFENEISFCAAYGTAYNPSKESLKLESLNALLIRARASLSEVTGAKTRLDLAVNERQTLFNPLKPLSTRIINALQATDTSRQTIDDAKSINKKLQGKRSTTQPPADEEKRVISASQQSYDSLTDNFSKLINLISSEPAYTPNEEELKVETLHTLLKELHTANTNVINAYTVYSNALISRDSTLYADETGLVHTATSVKKYVKSLFGTNSPQYKQLSKLIFKQS